ncbi:MAG: DoxX family membrane protein [Acidobacteria bacterium]|nr:DoxX family membrane protein [Acidobacteriota bacterium]
MVFKALHWLCRLILAGVFLYSGHIKVQQPLQFAVALSGYRLIPENLILPIATCFPWIEILLGISFLIGWKIRHFAAAATALLLFFSLLLTITYLRGIEASCGCFSFDDPISPLTIARDGVIILPAIYLLLENRLRMGAGLNSGVQA